jgi:hypothetical protein
MDSFWGMLALVKNNPRMLGKNSPPNLLKYFRAQISFL